MQKTKTAIEHIIGSQLYGHRAPTFSITEETPWAFDILKKMGFIYDSSIYPIQGQTPRHAEHNEHPLHTQSPVVREAAVLAIPARKNGQCGRRRVHV